MPGRRSYYQLSIAILLASLLALPACEQPVEPIRIGLVAGLTGRGAELGQAGRNGVLLAIEELNRAGGINGRPVELLTADTGGSPEQARAAFDQLNEAKVAALIGPMLSQTALALKPAADQARLVMLAPTVSTPDLSGWDDYFYRIYPTSDITAPALADFARQEVPEGNFAIVQDIDNASFTQSWVQNFSKRVVANGGKVVNLVRFSSQGKESIHALVREIAAGPARGVLILANSVDTGHLAQHFKLAAPDIRLFASEWSTSGDLLAYGGKALEGMSFIATYDNTNISPAMHEFSESYEHRFDSAPRFSAMFGYEALQVLAMALQGQPGGPLSKTRMDQLGPLRLLNGTVRFNANGDVVRDVFISQVHDGRFRTVARVAETGVDSR